MLTPSPCVTVLNLVALGHTLWASLEGIAKKFGRSAPPLKMGVSDPLEIRPSPTSVTTANLVILDQTIGG